MNHLQIIGSHFDSTLNQNDSHCHKSSSFLMILLKCFYMNYNINKLTTCNQLCHSFLFLLAQISVMSMMLKHL